MGKSSGRSNNFSHAEKLLQQLTHSFLDGLSERCTALEISILLLGRNIDVSENYDELYRNVHSLKGSAGTHGIPLISNICHFLEDLLNSIAGNFSNIDPGRITYCLSCVDLINETGVIIRKGGSDLHSVESDLDKLRYSANENKLRILIVEPSPLMAQLYQSAIEKHRLSIVVVNDGMIALGRLLSEKFDIVITGNELKSLNGIGMMNAIKGSECKNKNITIIMITSTSELRFFGNIKPDHLIIRSADLREELECIMNELVMAY